MKSLARGMNIRRKEILTSFLWRPNWIRTTQNCNAAPVLECPTLFFPPSSALLAVNHLVSPHPWQRFLMLILESLICWFFGSRIIVCWFFRSRHLRLIFWPKDVFFIVAILFFHSAKIYLTNEDFIFVGDFRLRIPLSSNSFLSMTQSRLWT